MKYSAFELLCRQWSIKNEAKQAGLFLAALIVATIISIVTYMLVHEDKVLLYVIRDFSFWFLVFYVFLMIGYHILKFFLLGIYCYLLAKTAREGNVKSMQRYEEAWDWRK